MAWDENAKYSNVDGRDDDRCCDLEFRCSRSPFCDDGNSIDDDLHQELHFQCVEDKDEKEERRPVTLVSVWS